MPLCSSSPNWLWWSLTPLPDLSFPQPQECRMEKNPSSRSDSHAGKKPYEAPKAVVVDEKEMLKVFQITGASAASWWG